MLRSGVPGKVGNFRGLEEQNLFPSIFPYGWKCMLLSESRSLVKKQNDKQKPLAREMTCLGVGGIRDDWVQIQVTIRKIGVCLSKTEVNIFFPYISPKLGSLKAGVAALQSSEIQAPSLFLLPRPQGWLPLSGLPRAVGGPLLLCPQTCAPGRKGRARACTHLQSVFCSTYYWLPLIKDIAFPMMQKLDIEQADRSLCQTK